MTNTVTSALPPRHFRKFAIPLKWGLIAGPLMVGLHAIAYMVLLPKSFMAGTMLMLFIQQFPIIPALFYIAAALQQRTAMGGHINFREAFSSMFVVILFVNVLLTVWGLIYAVYIDPHAGEKTIEGYRQFMISTGRPQEFIDQKVAEQSGALQQGLTAKSVIIGLGQFILIHSVVAMLCGLIIRRKRA